MTRPYDHQSALIGLLHLLFDLRCYPESDEYILDDLKAEGFVQYFCLKIIQFDIAVQVKDEDKEVDGSCGDQLNNMLGEDYVDTLLFELNDTALLTGKVLRRLGSHKLT